MSPFFDEKFFSHSAEKIRGHSLNVSENIGFRKILCIIGVWHFPLENCLSHSVENFCKVILLFSRKLLVSKSFYGWKGGAYLIFRRKNMVSQCRKILWVSLQCFRNFVVSGKYTHNSGVTFFSRKFFVSQWRKLPWESHQCLENFRVSKNFLDNTGYHVSPLNILCLTEPKVCVKESYCFWENFWFPKVFTDEKGGVSHFSVEKIWSHSAEKTRGHLFNVSKIFGYRKTLCIIRVLTFFRQKFSVSKCRKFSYAFLQCFRKTCVSKKLMHKKVSQFSAGNCLPHSAEKILWRSPTVFEKVYDSENCLWIKGGVSQIAVQKFWSLSTESLREHPCNVSEKLW